MRLDPHFTVNDLNLPARQCAAHVRLTVSLFRADGRGKLRQAIATKRRNTLRARLLRLEALGLVAREDAPAGNHASGEAAQPPEGRWRVAPLAYLTVREFLRGRSYLTDAF